MSGDFLVNLLGRSLDDFELRRFIRDLGESLRILEEEDGTYYEFPSAGLAILFDIDLRVKAMYLHREGHDNYRGFGGGLPKNLSFDKSRKDVMKLLGAPSQQGGGKSSVLYARVPEWVRYDYGDYSLHAQFSPDGKLSLVTVMIPSAVPPRASSAR
jgi:hypothetical protein